MELNQFTNIDIILDKANDNIIQKQSVSAGDLNGRTLTAQITDDGVVGEVPGAALNLLWTNNANNWSDLTPFEIVDRAKSIFKITYPTNMLTPGKVTAQIQILHGGKVTHTKPFEIIIAKLAGQMRGVLQTAEFSALIDALAKTNGFEGDIRSLDIKKADEQSLIPINYDISELRGKKVDKGGANQISMQMLDQSLRESLTDGAVAVVGVQSVSLPQFNTTIQKDLGEWRDVSYNSVVGGWNSDGSADDSTYAQQYYKRTSINVSSGELITFALNLANLKRLVFVDESGSSVKMIEDSSTSIELSTPAGSTELRIQYYNSGAVIPIIKKLNYAGILSKPDTEKLVADTVNTISDTMYFTLPLVDGKAKYPNLDTKTQVLTIPKVTELTWKDGRLPLPNGAEIDLSKNTSGQVITGYVRKVYFNKKTSSFEVFGGSDPSNVKDYVFVATIRLSPLNATQKNLSISMNCRCLVNGEYYSPTEKEELNKVFESSSDGVTNFGLKETDNIKIVYHRGYNKNSPENVGYSFKQAKKRGAIWVECDIAYTSDGIPVILHDDSINRTARNDDGSIIDGEVLINNIPLSQAKTYDFGVYSGNDYKGERILSLDEFVKLCYQLSLKMRLELKQTVDGTRLNAIKTILEKYDMLKNCEFIGSYYNLNLAKDIFASTDLIYVVSTVTDAEINNANALKLSTNKVNLAMQIERINDPGNMQKVLDSGFDYEYWTIDTKDNLDKALQYIPKAVTTNHINYYQHLID